MYPINLNVKNKVCAVVGGGHRAYKAVKRLYDEGATVMVISPKTDVRMNDLPIAYVQMQYEESLLPESSFLVIAATDDCAVNRQVVKDARKNGSLVLDVTDPYQSDFSVCDYEELSELAFSVFSKSSQAGFSAALCKQIKKEYQKFDKAAAFVAQQEKILTERYPLQAPQLIYMMTEPEAMQVLIELGFDAYKQKLTKTFSYYL